MDDAEKKERGKGTYVGYEYKEVAAEMSMVPLLLDGYESFGWEQNENWPENGMAGNVAGSGGNAGTTRGNVNGQKMVIHLRRDRKIVNKVELTRLQRNFEACVEEIQVLERRKKSTATISALSLAIIGTAFMAGSTFAVTAQPPYIILCIILAVPGFLGWIVPYFLYRRVLEEQTEKVRPLIGAKYDEIYELCEKGNKLCGSTKK